MRIPEDEIGDLTIGQFELLLHRKKENDNRAQFNAGLIAAAVYNAAPFGDENRKALSPLDFVPDWNGERKKIEHDLTKLSPEEQRDYLKAMFGRCLTEVQRP